MIKARGTKRGGREVVLLGLSQDNIARLFADNQIVVRTAEPPPAGLSLADGPEIVLLAGSDEDAILAKLQAAGFSAQVYDARHQSHQPDREVTFSETVNAFKEAVPPGEDAAKILAAKAEGYRYEPPRCLSCGRLHELMRRTNRGTPIVHYEAVCGCQDTDSVDDWHATLDSLPEGIPDQRDVSSPPRVLPPEDELVAGVNEIELQPGLSARFGYCPDCRYVYPPEEAHVCEGTE